MKRFSRLVAILCFDRRVPGRGQPEGGGWYGKEVCRRGRVIFGLLLALSSMPVDATYDATVTGPVDFVTQFAPALGYAPETLAFTVGNQPHVSCAQYQYFVISPNSVTDAQTRKNMMTIVLEAKATGGQIEVAYDSTGGFCDQGMIGVYFISEL